ncbi:unnamed protein product [Heligmosomoides polygyrus]|uniref:NR LBD domain-containing protein n=1 Tax=Heligmosomoides polygyrus TaxID=6339 RepID=A0A3P8D3B1_HELPZ|nr:unnamed protein product [Heligmosomoides polygyrus]
MRDQTVRDDVLGVQSNRDSIGVYSSTARMLQERDTILSDLAANFAALNRRRLFLYSIDVPVEQVFGYRELPVAELKSISESLYQMTYLEPRLTAEFVHCDRFLQQAHLSETEMVNIFKNYDVTRQAIEEPFVTYKFGFLQRNCWVMLNRRYIDLNNTQKYFDDGTMDGLTLDHETAGKLFVPSLRNAMENVGARMQKHGITETEMIALSGVALYNPDVDGLSNATREKLFAARGQISRSLIDYYSSNSEPEPEVKLGTLYLDVYTFSTVHAIKTAENMHILDVFNIVPSLHERATRRRPKTNAAAGNVRRP